MVSKRAMEVAQTACVTELERANAKLRAELEQDQIKIAEVEEYQGSLRSGYQKLKHECESLCNTAETLKREKAEAKKSCKVKLLQFTLSFNITVCFIARYFMVFVLI
jgi:FtsZ-binding cell division protein ZapB